jgi:hypothetical protein
MNMATAAREFLVKYRMIFLVWAIIGLFVNLGLMLYLEPWTPKMGVANSPTRTLTRVICDWWVFKLPWALLAMSIVAKRMRWLAPRGKYQEGVEYPVFTTYTYVAIALCAALFAAAGILSFEFFDLPAGPAALSVTFFNPIIGFFTLWLGGVARSLIFGTGNPVFWAFGVGPSDGSTWIYLGIFYWWFREETKYGKNPILLIIWWVVIYWIWRTVWMFDAYVWLFPVPSLWARMTWFFTQFMPSGTFGSVAGLIAAEALIRAVERGHQAPHAAPPSA